MKLHIYLSAAILLSVSAFVGAFSFSSAALNGSLALLAIFGWYATGAAAFLIGGGVIALALARIRTGESVLTLKRHWLGLVNLGVAVLIWMEFLVGRWGSG